MTRMSARQMAFILATVTLGGLHGQAVGQTYPNKPVNVVVPFPAGGYVDSFARVVTAKLGVLLGQTMPVLNRPGAGGTVGAESVVRAPPDGYMLLVSGVSSLAIFEALRSKTSEAELPKLSYISLIASTPGVMTTSTQSGVTSFADLVEKVRKEPGRYSYGSAGPGTPSHLWSAEIVRALNLDLRHAAYKGGAPALQELANNQILWMIDTPVGSLPLTRAGKVTPLAVIAPGRIKQLPQVPSIAELGVPQLADKASTLYLAAPAGTPKAILDRLNQAYAMAIKDPEFTTRIDSFDSDLPDPEMKPEKVREAAEAEYLGWFKIVRESGVKVD
ncbi:MULTISPECIES: tripartite tricarboxylate transporter substrate binding protein [unclassified Beijerinckia]|uniref:Bug family tripartite tricarboxylate transporter substrate binding protein n=1 Tax=unclassified Beijerinckia TaxID=2638183 RepID=UPI00089C5321|nr:MULTISPECIES: tripartite tricarboxylate transporter substrate binding protein [unclassified Beijerinckia]MDH7795078.1 tripartite-type tricarboxylate transporter receptor subunit TctC [Beijerinckia sp. GAS462]SEB86679.1 Tripartite-type tricarboxylate transporter, receptor component TctC [Beijerinckia sp. 28-YEA-48]